MFSNDKETIKKSSGRFISFVHAFSPVRSFHMSLYSCKYSRRDYTQHQLLTILLFQRIPERRLSYSHLGSRRDGSYPRRSRAYNDTALHFVAKISLPDQTNLLRYTFENHPEIIHFPDATMPIAAVDSSAVL
jgi:hypothetical protein